MRYSEFNVKISYCYGAASDQKQESDTSIIGTKASMVGRGVLFTEETLTVAEVYFVTDSRLLPI